ncbi:hypothetical protein FAM19024_001846 [Propionibacterium freudenreichii]|uniref:hypothetical protein n=1 Tax=Propionibacterium freudenreichii TaxID=1744 RepID=UPI00243453D1|nr:hypothetical protein [Propionibacterium freudenreichii]WFF32385.1 hypothetical protein FAM19024_001846 [Propionibacterium freudenreichii]
MAQTVSWRPTDEMAAWMTQRGTDVHDPRGLTARTRTEMEAWRAAQAIDLARTGWTLADLAIITAATIGTIPDDTVPDQPGGDIAIALQDYQADAAALQSARDKVADLSASATLALEHAIAQWRSAHLTHTARDWTSLGVRVIA